MYSLSQDTFSSYFFLIPDFQSYLCLYNFLNLNSCTVFKYVSVIDNSSFLSSISSKFEGSFLFTQEMGTESLCSEQILVFYCGRCLCFFLRSDIFEDVTKKTHTRIDNFYFQTHPFQCHNIFYILNLKKDDFSL